MHTYSSLLTDEHDITPFHELTVPNPDWEDRDVAEPVWLSLYGERCGSVVERVQSILRLALSNLIQCSPYSVVVCVDLSLLQDAFDFKSSAFQLRRVSLARLRLRRIRSIPASSSIPERMNSSFRRLISRASSPVSL